MDHKLTEILNDSELVEIEARANAATRGPWESDNQQDSEHRYQFYMALAPDGESVFDTLNSSVGEIHEEADEDGVYRWDEVARCNIAFAAHARTDIPALCATVRALRAERDNYADEVNELTDQLAAVTQERDEERRLRAELKQIAQTGIQEVSSVGTALKETALIDFRARAVQICKDKASEYESPYPEASHALRAVAGKIERLE